MTTTLARLADINTALRENLDAARAPGTRRVYEQAWAAFARFAKEHDAKALPADPLLVAQYLTMVGETRTASTVRSHAAAIAARHRDANETSPCEHPGVKAALRGHRRRQTRAERQAAPLDMEACQRLCEAAREPRRGRGGTETEAKAAARGDLDIALVLTMRDAMLRRQEAAALTWAAIEQRSDGTGRLTIVRSKTDQEGEGAVAFLSAVTMEALSRLPYAHTIPEARVFRLSPSQICRRIGAAAKAAGLGGGYSGHSCRVGMALDLANAGMGLPEMMAAGRWQSSKMVARYTRSAAAGHGAVARLYAEAPTREAALGRGPNE